MPFTFFAHQVPVLPLKMRTPDRWDGLGLVVGSIIPDLWYVSSGWLYGPAGIPMWVDGHRLDLIIQNCIIPGFVITVLLRRFAMPVVPAVLPKGGFLRLRDYRLLALSRHRWWVTAYSVGLGAVTHIVLDAFTHEHGAVVEAVGVFSQPVLTIGDRQLLLYKALQFAGHIFGSLAGAYLLLVISRRKLQWAWHGWAGVRPPDPVVHEPGQLAIRTMLVVGVAAGLGYALVRWTDGDGAVTAFMAFCCVMLATVILVGRAGRRWVEPLPAPVDPLAQ